MADIERIGDHIDAVCDIALRQRRTRNAAFDRPTLEILFGLFEAAEKVLHLVIDSLNPENRDFQRTARNVLQARDEYMQRSLNAKAAFTERVANHEVPPIAGLFFSEYLSALDRTVKHAKAIALAEQQPNFWIKRGRLEQVGAAALEYPPPPPPDPHDFLDRLHSEDYYL